MCNGKLYMIAPGNKKKKKTRVMSWLQLTPSDGDLLNLPKYLLQKKNPFRDT